MSDLKRLLGIGFTVSAYLIWWLMIRLRLLATLTSSY